MESLGASSTYLEHSKWNSRKLALKEIQEQRTSSPTNEMAKYPSPGSSSLRLEALACEQATCFSCALQNDAYC